MSKVRLLGFILLVVLSSASLSFGAPPPSCVAPFCYNATNPLPMNNYCMQPPFVAGTIIHPNVVLAYANSPNTGRRAYRKPVDVNPTAAFDPAHEYFGYFYSDNNYSYNNSGFHPENTDDPKGTDLYDGNFMNWIAMREVDLMAKIITGGKGVGNNRNGNDLPTIVAGEPSTGDYDGTDSSTQDLVANRRMTGATACLYIANDVVAGICTANSVKFELKGNNGANKGSLLTITNEDTGNSADVEIIVNYAVGTEPSGVVLDNGGLIRWGIEVLNDTDGGKFMNSSAIVSPCNASFYTACGTGGTDCNALIPNSAGGGNQLAEMVWSAIGMYSQGFNPTSSADLGNGTGTVTNGANGPEYGGAGVNGVGDDPYDYSKDVVAAPHSCNNNTGSPFLACAKSFILLLASSDPSQDASLPTDVLTIDDTYAPDAFSNLPKVTLYGHVNDVAGTATSYRDVRKDLGSNQDILTYVVQASFDNSGGSAILSLAAKNGGFNDANGNFVPDLASEWDQNGDNVPDTFFYASDGNKLRAQIDAAIRAILRRASSGTAASIIGAGKGSGANLLQAFFFPAKDVVFEDTISTLTWIGFLQNFWFEVNPLLAYTNIRDDGDEDQSLAQLDDAIDVFQFNPQQGKTKIKRYQDTSPADGFPDSVAGVLTPADPPEVDIDKITSLWEAGANLFTGGSGPGGGYGAGPGADPGPGAPGDLTGDDRTIYTSVVPPARMDFTTANCGTLQPLMQATDCTATTGVAWQFIKYVRGTDFTGFRNRTVTIPMPPWSPSGGGTDVKGTWKLGDIIDSTAKIQGGFELNDYFERYGDSTYHSYVTDSATAAVTYKEGVSMVYSGANDGMFHAFNMGKLDSSSVTSPEIVELKDPGAFASKGKGKEQWAYVPKNMLPYLRYMADPNYCHLYYVDLPSKVFDAAIDEIGQGDPDDDRTMATWRTIVIGGMGLGGGCGCTSGADCIESVMVGGAHVGLSSYFAFDVTDPYDPVLLWEFSDDTMGYAFTTPAIVRIGDPGLNGHWFVVIGSGPTGGINTAAHQFLGKSGQSAKLFVLDLKDGSLERTIDLDTEVSGDGLGTAWVGALSAPFDLDTNEADELVYLSITKEPGGESNQWDNGDVLRLYTKESATPSDWEVNKLLSADVGPVTSKVAGLMANNKSQLWLYFGTGRYYYKLSSSNDDSTGTGINDQRKIFGFKDPCFNNGVANKIDPTCTDTVDPTALTDVTVNLDPVTDGWFIDLCAPGDDASTANCPAAVTGDLEERVISDTQTSSLGVVFFTSFEPSNDACTFGGKTFIYALKFDTGGTGASFLFGTAIIQTSTGEIHQESLSKAFGGKGLGEGGTDTNDESHRTATTSGGDLETLGRRTDAFLGQAPVESPLIILTPPPIQRVLRLKEN
jgi:type IV pilus assembly protein PilY1